MLGTQWGCAPCPDHSTRLADRTEVCTDRPADTRTLRKELWGDQTVSFLVGETKEWESVRGVTCAAIACAQTHPAHHYLQRIIFRL